MSVTPERAAPAPADPSAERPPYGVAAAVTLVVLALYALTIAPTTQFWDTSEYIAAAKVLGIPHPPGNPLFVLLANVWGRLPMVEHYALRINLLAALTSALATGFLFLAADRFLRNVMPGPRWARLAAAAAGALVGATTFTVWNQSVVNEKVYTLSLLSIALVVWLAVHWGDQPAGERRDHWLILIVYLVALSATNHLMGLFVVPFVFVYVLYTDPSALLRWRIWLAAVLVAGAGLSVFAFLWYRAGHYPPINEGEPTTWDALVSVLSREQYQKPSFLSLLTGRVPRQADLSWQYAHYVQYFTWQFASDFGPRLRNVAAALFAALGLLGAVRHFQRDRRGAVAMTALMATVTVALVFYLDFKYGFSIRPELGDAIPREVRERDYFYIASFQLWGVWTALGLGTVMGGVAQALRGLAERDRWLAATPVLLLALVPLLANQRSASRAGETFPRDTAWDILQSVEPHGILITAGDNDLFPLWYMQEVEGVRRDVLLANMSLMNTIWHVRQLKRRERFPFDTAAAIGPYRGREWPAPDEPALSLSYEQIDLLPPYQVAGEGRAFRVGNLIVAQNVLERRDLVTLLLIQDNLGKRPVYFSRTTGAYGDQLGFTPYLLGQGLARKLMPDSIRASDTVRYVPSLGWVDLPRTETLLFDYLHMDAAAAARPCGWVDRASEGMLQLYWLLYGAYGSYVTTYGWVGPDGADSTRARAENAMIMAERVRQQTSLAEWRAGAALCARPPATE